MPKLKLCAISIISLLFYFILSQLSYAKQCSTHLKFGVIIAPNHIRIVEQSKTQFQINNSKQLFIGGREIILSSSQTQLLEKFSHGIRQQIPIIVSIGIEGIDVSLQTINHVITGLTVENSAAQQKIQAKFDELKWRIRTRFNQSTDNYYIAPQDLTDFYDILTGEFTQEIESMISNSIGTILETVAKSVLSDTNNSDKGSELRINVLDPKLTNISSSLSEATSIRVGALNNKIALFCSQLKQLNEIEDALHLTIPETAAFNIIEILDE